MTSEFIDHLRRNTPFDIKYDPFGTPSQVVITGENTSTCIPKGNDNFQPLIDFIDSREVRPLPKVNWCQIVCNAAGEALHYRTNEGNFIDDDNPVSRIIKAGISSGEIELRAMDAISPVVVLQVHVFLPRAYTLSDVPQSPINHYDFDTQSLGLPFSIPATLVQSIDAEFFNGQDFFRQQIKNLDGNIIQISIPGRRIKSIFKWATAHLDSETFRHLTESRNINICLHKRSKSQGPTTDWYFDWMTLQHFLWIPVLQITNRLIGLMNLQAHRKTVALFSRDDLGDVVCIKSVKADKTHALFPLSSLRDSQITIFPSQLNWDHKLIDRSFFRVRYLLDRSLYFEAIVVAQAVLEAIINGMFTQDLMLRLFDRSEIKWAEKYDVLRRFFEGQILGSGALVSYLKTGLYRIYQIRNKYCHDVFAHQPVYDFTLGEMQEISTLLKPMVDPWESNLFLQEVSRMYDMRSEFWNWLASRKETQLK